MIFLPTHQESFQVVMLTAAGDQGAGWVLRQKVSLERPLLASASRCSCPCGAGLGEQAERLRAVPGKLHATRLSHEPTVQNTEQ